MFRFAITIFVSAFLLFQVQPLIGRFILPWFGGGPSIWTACMLFFQLLLLAGYLYAHLLSVLLRVRTQVIVHFVLLTCSLAFLPIAPGDAWKPSADQSPLLHILMLLLATVGGPYFILSSTGPLMQKWFSRTCPGRSPYRLYALSNIGSLLALLSYPFVFEPWLTLKQQVWSWSGVYVGYVALAGWCGMLLWKHSQLAVDADAESALETGDPRPAEMSWVARPGIGLMLLWILLAACGSGMLLATTNQLCIDVATVPFLWILPLSLYLISFIICFDSPRWYDRKTWGILLAVCAPLACWVVDEGADVRITKQVAIYSAVLAACCMTCHGELAALKPHPRYLTLYFVLVSAGGALGGLFVAIVAPYTFHGYWEYHIGLAACCVVTLLAWCAQRIWLRTPPVEYWALAMAAAIHVALTSHFLYEPLNASLSAVTETTLFGVYALLLIAGLTLTHVFAGRERMQQAASAFLFPVISGWFYGYGHWKFPASMNTGMSIFLLSSAVAFPAAAVSLPPGLRWLQRLGLRQITLEVLALGAAGVCGWLLYREWTSPDFWNNVWQRRIYISLLVIAAAMPLAMLTGRRIGGIQTSGSNRIHALGCVFPMVTATLGAMYSGEWIQGWQAVSLTSTIAAAFMMEWSASGILGPGRLSPGLWFWVPGITLVTMLGNQLAEIVTADNEPAGEDHTVHMSRNFYGVLRVRYEAAEEGEEMPSKFALTHGQIRHGFQFDDDYWGKQPTTYYGRESGVGLAISTTRRWAKESDNHPIRVGVVGLGTGTIAVYGETGEYFRFYDINPDVLKLSTDEIFTYLRDSGAKTDVVIGDARIVMEREVAEKKNQQFDVLAIDAFSSDAIPVHLLTSECAEIYRQQLRPGGILAVHISNRFLDLNPVTRGMAEILGWHAIRIDNDDNDLTGVFSSTWILLTSRADLAEDPEIQAMEDPWDEDEKTLHWTDDYSGLWQILSF